MNYFKRCLLISVIGTFLMLRGQVAEAQIRPVIYVPVSSGYAWWARDLEFRPTSTAVAGIPLGELNAMGEARRGMKVWAPVCHVDLVTPASIASIDRETQADIDRTLREFPNSFSVQYSDAGAVFTVRVVAFETCGDEPEAGTALLITDGKGKLKAFDKQEFEFTRILKRDDGKINVFGCFACGDVSELSYDTRNDRFYYQWIGH